MTSYLRFESEHGVLLLETDAVPEALPGSTELPAGLGVSRWARNQSGQAIAIAQTGFHEAVRTALSLNIPPFLAAADELPDPPAEIEITFGLKGTGELGNLAVGKVAGECSYQVKMVWRRDQG